MTGTIRRCALGFFLAVAVLVAGRTVASASIAGPVPSPTEPEGNQACLNCHSRPGHMVRDGRTISIQVDPATYDSSVHGIISCVRCHIEIGPEHAADPNRPLGLPTGREARVQISRQCVKCHAGVYERSYNESFHGIAVRHGDDRAATCVDCHGSHGVLPSRNPASSVHPDRLAATCGAAECHPGAPANFAQGKEHFVVSRPETAGGLHVVYKFFLALILFDTMKDGPIVMFDLLRRLQR
jgi:hypothetical protein